MITSGTQAFAAAQYSLIRRSYVIDEKLGPTCEVEWQGTETAIKALEKTITAERKIMEPLNGPLWVLRATYTGALASPESPQPTEEEPYDRWAISTAVLERSIFSHPKVWAAAIAYDSATPTKFKKELEDYAEDSGMATASSPAVLGSSTAVGAPWNTTVGTVAGEVLKELGRGATQYEDEYLVLRRVRSISVNYPVPMPLYSVKYIYVTNQLPIPPDVLFSLPTIPPAALGTPEQSMWGWRLKSQQSDFMGPGRIEQSFEWVLAAWSLCLYQAATELFPE